MAAASPRLPRGRSSSRPRRRRDCPANDPAGLSATATDRRGVSASPPRPVDEATQAGKRDLWADWKNGIYIGSVAIGVLLPVFFFFVRP